MIEPIEPEVAPNQSSEAPPLDEGKPVVLPSPTRPLLGPALWIGGATLWAYVVAGQFVLRADMPEVLGIGFVVGVMVSTAYLACGRSLERLPARGAEAQRARFVKPTWVGVAVAAGVVVLISLLLTRAGDGPAMLLLLLISLAGVVLGKRFTGRPLTPLRGGRRALGVVLWITSVVLALMVVTSAVG